MTIKTFVKKLKLRSHENQKWIKPVIVKFLI